MTDKDATAERPQALPAAELWRKSLSTHHTANEFLKAGLAVGAIGAAGAAIGAVCPICVVATPALLGLGAVSKLRAMFLGKKAVQADTKATNPVPTT
jgi:hypothetical protein